MDFSLFHISFPSIRIIVFMFPLSKKGFERCWFPHLINREIGKKKIETQNSNRNWKRAEQKMHYTYRFFNFPMPWKEKEILSKLHKNFLSDTVCHMRSSSMALNWFVGCILNPLDCQRITNDLYIKKIFIQNKETNTGFWSREIDRRSVQRNGKKIIFMCNVDFCSAIYV